MDKEKILEMLRSKKSLLVGNVRPFAEKLSPLKDKLEERFGSKVVKYGVISVFLFFIVVILSALAPGGGKKGDYILAFRSYESCSFSNLKGSLPVSCDEAVDIAQKKADSYQWPFKTLSECQANYLISNCRPNSSGYLTVIPAGFAYVESSDGKNIVPVYKSVTTEHYVLPSGYPVRIGESTSTRSLVKSAIQTPKSLGRTFCSGVICESMTKHMGLKTASQALDAIAMGQ